MNCVSYDCIKKSPGGAGGSFLLTLAIADVLFLVGIEGQVADGSNQGINAHGQEGQPEIGAGSAGVAFGLEGSVVDDDASDKAQEEGQQEANHIVVIHDEYLFSK